MTSTSSSVHRVEIVDVTKLDPTVPTYPFACSLLGLPETEVGWGLLHLQDVADPQLRATLAGPLPNLDLLLEGTIDDNDKLNAAFPICRGGHVDDWLAALVDDAFGFELNGGAA